MTIDKKYCMSSYMAFRYIEKDETDFYPGMNHKNIVPIPDDQRILVHTSDDIDREIGKQMEQFKDKKKGILLSGGAHYTTHCEKLIYEFLVEFLSLLTVRYNDVDYVNLSIDSYLLLIFVYPEFIYIYCI